MKLIVGLGNPGLKYENTWHNLGFLVIDQLLAQHDLGQLKKSWRFKAEILKAEIYGVSVLLVTPQTFMNNSGQAVAAIAKYHKIKTEDIIVIHDDLDLPWGKIRLSHDSSAGGHNGVKSIIEHLGNKKFMRVKIGIKTERLNQIEPTDYVLTGWNKKDAIPIEEQTKKAADAAVSIIKDGLTKAMNEWNG